MYQIVRLGSSTFVFYLSSITSLISSQLSSNSLITLDVTSNVGKSTIMCIPTPKPSTIDYLSSEIKKPPKLYIALGVES